MQARIIIDVEVPNDRNGYLSLHISKEGIHFDRSDETEVSRFTFELAPQAISPSKLTRLVPKDSSDLTAEDKDTMENPQ